MDKQRDYKNWTPEALYSSKQERKAFVIIDISMSGCYRVSESKLEYFEKSWNLKKIKVFLVVIGTLCSEREHLRIWKNTNLSVPE